MTELWPTEGLAMIGAMALRSRMSALLRVTYDLDVTVALSREQLPTDLSKLVGWSPDRALEHRWVSSEGVKLDVIPIGPDLLDAGKIVWKNGREMSLLGFRHVLARATEVSFAPNLRFAVADIPTLVLLKMNSYLESGRERDLEDLGAVLEGYEDTDRRFGAEVLEAGIDFENAGAYLLGYDLAPMLNEREMDVVQRFLQRAEGGVDGARTETLMRKLGPVSWRTDEDALPSRIKTIRMGLAHRSAT